MSQRVKQAIADLVRTQVADAATGCHTPGELADRVEAVADAALFHMDAVHMCVVAITKLAHKHEVQTWLDHPGTDADKLDAVLRLAREALHHIEEM
jgi:hypothetical protein